MPELQDFAGRWQIARRIEDRRAGAEGRFDGEANLTATPGGLLYHERGSLTLGAAPPMTAERRYLWSAAPGGRIAVAFDDGRPFHSFTPAGHAKATHCCAPDSYAVAYDFTRWPDWRASWTVRGPRKDYRMDTAYSH
jgi:hypothetical protein